MWSVKQLNQRHSTTLLIMVTNIFYHFKSWWMTTANQEAQVKPNLMMHRENRTPPKKQQKNTPLGLEKKRQHGEQKGVGRGWGVGVGGACRLAWSPVAAVERAGSAPFPGLGLLRPKLPKIATHTQPALRRQEQQVYSLSPPLSLSPKLPKIATHTHSALKIQWTAGALSLSLSLSLSKAA